MTCWLGSTSLCSWIWQRLNSCAQVREIHDDIFPEKPAGPLGMHRSLSDCRGHTFRFCVSPAPVPFLERAMLTVCFWPACRRLYVLRLPLSPASPATRLCIQIGNILFEDNNYNGSSFIHYQLLFLFPSSTRLKTGKCHFSHSFIELLFDKELAES